MSLRGVGRRVMKACSRGRLRQLGLAAVGALAFGCLLLIASFYAVPLPERLSANSSPVVLWADGTPAHVFLAEDDRWRVAVDVDDVDPDYVDALIRLEDKRFFGHVGVDPIAIGRAAVLNARRGRVVSGGSTLTMQLVRMVEPRPRSLRSKLVEAWRAVQIEWFFTKDQIAGAYLTFAPYGKNLEGVEAASWAYFGHGADELSTTEIATLLAVPQAPNSRYPSPRNERRLGNARDEIARFLVLEGVTSTAGTQEEEILREIEETPVPTQLKPFPRSMPVVSRWLLERYPTRTRIHSTIHRDKQRRVASHARTARFRLQEQGIHHGAVVVSDNQTGEVVALVGNLTPEGKASGDQIPMFDVPRSPGSALKPFIYALAIDEGMALPEQLIEDVPATYLGYAPTNYDGEYRGLVALEQALSQSLNLPFVFLLRDVGVDAFLARLRIMGVEHLSDEPDTYGLGLAVGGVEVTPLEVTGMYTALANAGTYRPLRVTGPGQEPPEGTQVMRQGSAWLTRRGLRLRDRPDFPDRLQYATVQSSIHWKTGTSFGHRDAWSCGSDPQYTACVWVGNADRSPARNLVGAEAAGPLMFNVLESLSDPGLDGWVDPRPNDLVEVEVDAYSGFIPTEASPSTKRVWALEDRVPSSVDPFHIRLEIDLANGHVVHAGCRGDRQTRQETFVVYPSGVRRWLSTRAVRGRPPPPYAPGCRPQQRGEELEIMSPISGEVRALIPGMARDDQEIPLEAKLAWSGSVSWFVNGKWLGTVDADSTVWWVPEPGEHEVVARDEHGHIDTVRFKVIGAERLARGG